MSNILDLMSSSDPAILWAVLSRLLELYRTSKYAVDIVISLAIHHYQPISRVCIVAVSCSHCIPYIVVCIEIFLNNQVTINHENSGTTVIQFVAVFICR